LRSGGGTAAGAAVRSHRRAHPRRGPGLGHRVDRPDLSAESFGSPRFLGVLDTRAPCSATPVGPDRLAIAAARC